MPRPLIDGVRADQMVEDYLGGATRYSLARKYGIAPVSVKKVLVSRGVEIRPRHLPVPVKEMKQRYAAGDSANTLSSLYGVSPCVIRRLLVTEGVAPRGSSEAGIVRNTRLTAEQRRERARCMNDAWRGHKISHDELCRLAKSREGKNFNIGKDELVLAEMLEERGIRCARQVAIGPYLCDMTSGTVAVEVFGGNWHFSGRHWARLPQRTRYILDAGWSLIMVLVGRKAPLTARGAEEIVSLMEKASRDEASRSHYWMVSGTGELVSEGGLEDDEITMKRALHRGAGVSS